MQDTDDETLSPRACDTPDLTGGNVGYAKGELIMGLCNATVQVRFDSIGNLGLRIIEATPTALTARYNETCSIKGAAEVVYRRIH